MRVIFTGSRTWPADDTLWLDVVVAGLVDLGMVAASIGDCRTGVDALLLPRLQDALGAENVTRFEATWNRCFPRHPVVPCRHRPSWGGRCPAAGLRRNQEMVDVGGDRCVALSDGPITDSRGTFDCAVRAKIAGIPVVTLDRDPAL